MIVAFTGKAGSGKDTAAGFLTSFETESFAAPLYHGVAAIFGVPVHKLRRREVKEGRVPGFNFTYRKALQLLGTEWRDLLEDRMLWVKLLDARICEKDNIVITDLRFNHEAEWVKSKGGVIINIVASFEDAPLNIDNPNHISEGGISESLINMTIHNDGTLEDFRLQVLDAVEVATANNFVKEV